jgi:hypothetical protein
MGLRLPGELTPLLGLLGHTWPETDEERLLEMGRSWIAFSGRVDQPVGDAAAHARRLLSGGEGEAFDAFRQSWSSGDGPGAALKDGATAATVIGTALIVCSGIVLALKINIIVQLSQLAVQISQAVTAAPATSGASLAAIAVCRQRASALIGTLTTMATRAVSGS